MRIEAGAIPKRPQNLWDPDLALCEPALMSNTASGKLN